MILSSLPYPGLPYGIAPAWCFPVTELSLYALMGLCILHARKIGHQALVYLFGGLIFGLLLEYFEVVGNSYTYGRFWVMLGRAPFDVPLCIGCGWAIIMDTARCLSERERLPLLAAAALDTLLALNIDLSMDVVAYRLHMWHWYWDTKSQNPLTAQWFGIPYGNFVGWITVVFCYSAFSRLLERYLVGNRKTVPLRAISVLILSIACSLGVLVLTENVVFPLMIKYAGITSGRRLILLTVALIALTVLGWFKRQPSTQPLAPVARWVPCWFHFFFLLCFFVLGFYRENPWMTAAACLNGLIGVAMHLAPGKLRASTSLGILSDDHSSGEVGLDTAK